MKKLYNLPVEKWERKIKIKSVNKMFFRFFKIYWKFYSSTFTVERDNPFLQHPIFYYKKNDLRRVKNKKPGPPLRSHRSWSPQDSQKCSSDRRLWICGTWIYVLLESSFYGVPRKLPFLRPAFMPLCGFFRRKYDRCQHWAVSIQQLDARGFVRLLFPRLLLLLSNFILANNTIWLRIGITHTNYSIKL